MKRILRNLGIGLMFLVIFLGSIATTARAQTATPIPIEEQPISSDDLSSDAPDFTTEPGLAEITDSTKSVKVTFNNLEPGKDYSVCSGSPICFSGLSSPETAGTVEVSSLLLHLLGDDRLSPSVKSTGDTVSFTFCGNGDDKVKLCSGTDAKDYFFGGKIYSFSVGLRSDNSFIPLKMGFFYVPRSYPTPKIDPQKNITTANSLKVTLDPTDSKGQSVFRGGGDTGFWRRNNYQISLIGGQGYSQKACVGWENDKQINTVGTIFSNLSRGRYTVSIREQSNDDIAKIVDSWRPQAGRMVNPIDGGTGGCDGGFLYWRAICNVTAKAPGGDCTEFKKDPSGEEYSAFLKSINDLNKINGVYRLPCGSGKPAEKNSNVPCPKVNTAIGDIDVATPQAFITAMFRYVLAIAAFGGVILIIVSGYIMMTSSGDKEKVQGARETVTAAIVGLLFIILSIVIFEIIGVDLLRLPGFGK